MLLQFFGRFSLATFFFFQILISASAQNHANSEGDGINKRTQLHQLCDKILDLGPDVLLCSDSTVVFDATVGFATYLWSDGSGNSTLAASMPGVYWLEVTDTCGNVQMDSILLSFSLVADTQFPDTVICPEESVLYAAPGFDTYSWFPAAGLSCTNCPAVFIQPQTATQYILTASNNMGCVVQDTFLVSLRPLPTRTDTIWFCVGDTVTLNGITYTEPGSVIDKIKVPGVCDTIVTYVLLQLPQPKRTETVLFTPGQTVTIQGMNYSQPDTIELNVPSATGGCDSLITYILRLDPVITDTCETSETFVKYFGTAAEFEIGYTMCAAADGNIFLAGTQGFPKAMLVKITPSGAVLWSRILSIMPLEQFHISQLIEDSDGMLVACGNFSEGDNNRKAGVFRYDPVSDSMLWLKVIAKESPTAFSILELTPGGNFLMSLSPQLAANVNDVELWELERATGNLINGLAKRYDLGSADEFTAMVLKDGFLYATGRLTTTQASIPVPFGKMRHALIKIDLHTGLPVWSQLSHVDTSAQTFLYGMDLILDDDALVSAYRGYDTTQSISIQQLYLQKTNLDGQVIWNKRYELPGNQVEELVRVPDGYVLYGEFLDGTYHDLFVLKTDTNGVPVWAYRIPNVSVVNSSYNDGKQGELAVLGDRLFIVATSVFPGDIVVLKLDANGSAGTDCNALIPINVPVAELVNPVNTPVQLTYTQHPGIWIDTLSNTTDISIAEKTYCVQCAPPCMPVLDSVTIIFCPGDTVFVAGMVFTQPGVYLDTLNASTPGVCDTIVSYSLQFEPSPQPSLVTVQCPANSTVNIPATTNTAIVNYAAITASTDCPCGSAIPGLIQGLASGAPFPVGQTVVCYQATDACGNSQSCCFTVSVLQQAADTACDVKNTACIKFELLGISQNADKEKTYRMRVTNSCMNRLEYVAFQLPDGLTAVKPADGSVYPAAPGQPYNVRNPNYSPFYSIRFKTQGNGIASGQSGIFEYTLPPQANPDYIHAIARLEPQVYFETHLNVFGCAVQQTVNKPGDLPVEREIGQNPVSGRLLLYPNPANNILMIDLSGWQGTRIRLNLYDAFGRRLLDEAVQAGAQAYTLELPVSWPRGLYTVEVVTENGEQQLARFVRAWY